MEIREGDDYIEFEEVDRVPSDMPTPGDVEISIAVHSSKFIGHGFGWIDASTMAAFLQQLRELEKRRQGSATLEGMSPGVFHFRIFSVDRRGHIAVAGRIVKEIRSGEAGCYQPYTHAIEFGFEFDPTKLPRILSDFVRLSGGGNVENGHVS